jgi:hypothetical protein
MLFLSDINRVIKSEAMHFEGDEEYILLDNMKRRERRRRGTDERILLKCVMKMLDVNFLRWDLLHSVRYLILSRNNVTLSQ